MVRSGLRNRFLASCWVMVEPPCDDASGFGVPPTGAHEADGIDAEMVVEAPVLGGDHGLRQIRRQPVEPHIAAPQPALGEHGAVAGKDGEVWRAVVEGKQHRVRQPRDENHDRGAERQHADQRGCQTDAQRGLQDRVLTGTAAARLACCLAPLAGRWRRAPAAKARLDARARLAPPGHGSLPRVASAFRRRPPANPLLARLGVPD